MTEKQLKQLAIDIVERKVFGTFQMSENDMNHLQIVFMPFIALNEEQRQKMNDDKIIHVYEYYDKAGPRAVNGMPIFMSMLSINEDDWKKIKVFIETYKIKINSFLEDKKVKTEEPTLF